MRALGQYLTKTIICCFSVVVISCGDEEVGPSKTLYENDVVQPDHILENSYAPIIILRNEVKPSTQSKTPVQNKPKATAKTLTPKLVKGVYLISQLPSGVYVKTDDNQFFKLKKTSKLPTSVSGKVTIYNSKSYKEVQLLTTTENKLIKIKPGKKYVFDAGEENGITYLKDKRKWKSRTNKAIASL